MPSETADISARSRPFWHAPAMIMLAAMVILALNMGLRQTFGLFIEPMTSDLGLSHGTFALAIAVQNLLWGALTPFCGALADRYGTGRVLVAGLVLYSVALLSMSFGESAFSLHLSAGLLTGIAISASGFPLVLAAVARSVPEEKRSFALGFTSAGGSIGQFVLLPVSQVAISDYGWSAALVLLAILAAIGIPLAACLSGKAKAGGGADSQTLGEAIREAGGHRGFILLTLGFFVCGFHVAFVATHLPGYVTSEGLDPLVGATALSLIGFFNILGSFSAGWLGGRFRKKYVLTAIYLGRTVAIAVLILGPKDPLTIYVFGAIFGVLWLSTVPLTSGLVGDIFGPRYMATLFGIVMFSHQMGAFFGAYLGGVSYDLTGGYDVVWLGAAALGVLAAVLHFPIADARVRREAGTRAATSGTA